MLAHRRRPPAGLPRAAVTRAFRASRGDARAGVVGDVMGDVTRAVRVEAMSALENEAGRVEGSWAAAFTEGRERGHILREPQEATHLREQI